ncbi:Hypothetical protein I595_32 [Croceitalea dokdonensis DOKDO 023]|uniref:Uncharacterized protein n=1 Tax=Croceitalea dokdonensis DOKDO 023 TaxID=1300341 RepID=A0A0P7AMJ9_9FLAO|nr:Hypothetical protein I595_32 [Croceitalea dokdonensis DOKDO 023]
MAPIFCLFLLRSTAAQSKKSLYQDINCSIFASVQKDINLIKQGRILMAKTSFKR